MGHRRTQRFVRPSPRTKIWIGQGVALTTLGTGASTLIAVFNAAALALRPFTILRTRVSCNFRSDQTATTEDITGAFGMIVVKESAATIGITAVPTPLTEVDADFFVYQGMTAPFTSLTSVGFQDGVGVRYDIDSKAMRKVGTNDDVAVVMELRSTGGAEINIEGRQLIQLH